MGDKTGMDETGNGFSRLRDEAEGKLVKSLDAPPELEGRDPAEIIHELRIHQIELDAMPDGGGLTIETRNAEHVIG